MICAPAQEAIYRCVTVLRDPPGKLDNQRVIRNGIIKDSVILGYNASGKTNLGLAMMDIIVHLTNEKWSRGSSIFLIIYAIMMLLSHLHIHLSSVHMFWNMHMKKRSRTCNSGDSEN